MASSGTAKTATRLISTVVVAALLGGESSNVSDEELDRITDLVEKARKGRRK